MIADSGAGLDARKASVDLFGLEQNDFIDQVQDIITVGESYTLAAGGRRVSVVPTRWGRRRLTGTRSQNMPEGNATEGLQPRG
jgi:hypothetical protein